MKVLDRSTESITKLRLAWQKSRSIAAENGHLDLLEQLDWAVWDERTLDLLLSYEHGTRELDMMGWLNLVSMVEHSASWAICLVSQQAELPDITDILAGR